MHLLCRAWLEIHHNVVRSAKAVRKCRTRIETEITGNRTYQFNLNDRIGADSGHLILRAVFVVIPPRKSTFYWIVMISPKLTVFRTCFADDDSSFTFAFMDWNEFSSETVLGHNNYTHYTERGKIIPWMTRVSDYYFRSSTIDLYGFTKRFSKHGLEVRNKTKNDPITYRISGIRVIDRYA
ncbi:hypothetical protein CLF_113560 [Clonorchis sinensis]|uniref:Uncharacterized protein n=1 Tax=Clonorchis sinensis TaxID=79923 RepID=G7YMV3_CLOSI|nr:hypothetical protein CLF_113560 [Clonorchis sinensis]